MEEVEEIIEVNGKKIKLDEDGYLADFKQWDKEVAEYFAKRDGVVLTPKHWEIIYLAIDYYKKFQISPLAKTFHKLLTEKYGLNFSVNNLDNLFPLGYYNSVLLYSGLRSCC